ncbi:MAG: GH39 family glycosyl hydrolase [Acidobacteriota bacterium]
MSRFAGILLCAAFVPAALAQNPSSAPADASSAPVAVQVDLASSEGAFRPITNWFGMDESNYASMPYGLQLLRELHDLSPSPIYIRSHHLLTSGDGVPELKWSSSNVFRIGPDGKPIYDFTITDRTFDAYKQAGVRPMVELGFMPKDLAASVPGITEYQLHYPKPTMGGSVNNPPRDYNLWRDLIHTYVAHLVQRYGADEVRTWYFEVWNEPDILYWHGTPQEYFKLYDYAVDGVRAALPDARVGGPALTGPAAPKAAAFFRAFLDHCQNDRSAANGKPIPLDFISFHPKGRPRIVDGHLQMGLSNELQATEAGFRIVAGYPKFRQLPIILSEADPEGCAACSAREHPANAYRNGPLYASYTAAAVKSMLDLEKQDQVNLIAMLSWSFEFENGGIFEGLRTMSTRGIDKPILNLFRMIGLMGGDRVQAACSGRVPLEDLVQNGARSAPDIDALATRNGRGAAVLLWNYSDNDVPAPAAQIQVAVAGVPAGVTRVLLERDRIDDTHSNAYTVWKQMGSPESPTPEQLATLKAAGQLQTLTSPEWLDVHDGKVKIESNLPRQAVALLRLSW